MIFMIPFLGFGLFGDAEADMGVTVCNINQILHCLLYTSMISEIIAQKGGNVVAVHHDRADLDMDINACYLHLVMETRDHAHVEEIKQALTDAGFNIVK